MRVFGSFFISYICFLLNWGGLGFYNRGFGILNFSSFLFRVLEEVKVCIGRRFFFIVRDSLFRLIRSFRFRILKFNGIVFF